MQTIKKKRKFILRLLYLLAEVKIHSFSCVECVNAEKRKKQNKFEDTQLCFRYYMYL